MTICNFSGAPGVQSITARDSARRCRLARDARLLIHDGQARLFDLRYGRFYALDAVGTRMLTQALETSPVEAAAALAEEYRVTPERIRADWETLARTLRRNGLLAADDSNSLRRRLPGRLQLFFLLALAWVSVRLLGWAAAVRFWRRGKPASGERSVASQDIVEAVSLAIRESAAKHLLNTECKERALVAWLVLRRQFGLSAQLVVGAIPFPFQAHAWVECGCWTVSDDRANCEVYTPIVRYS